MAETEVNTREKVKLAHRYLVQLGKRALDMAKIKRETLYFPDQKENDAEHSYHLSLTAAELAAQFYPELNTGLVAQFANVHDLVEVITGDVPSYSLTKKQRKEKREMEQKALEELLPKLPPHTADLVERYEAQEEPEARFVCVVDKILPSVMHIVATEANKDEFHRRYVQQNGEHLAQLAAARTRQLHAEYPEFTFIHMVRQLSATEARKRLREVGTETT